MNASPSFLTRCTSGQGNLMTGFGPQCRLPVPNRCDMLKLAKNTLRSKEVRLGH